MRRAAGLLARILALLAVAAVGAFAAAAVDDGTELAPTRAPETIAGSPSSQTTVASEPAGTVTSTSRPARQRPPAAQTAVAPDASRPRRTAPAATSVAPAVSLPQAGHAPPSAPTAQIVPNVVGQTYPQAAAMLRRAGFEVVASVVTTLTASRDLRVLYQSPPPGQPAPRRTRVVLTVERYIPPPPDRTTTG